MSELVSIYVPTRDRVELLERALASALAQRHRPLEIVVVDDASRDTTRRRLGELAARHPELRVFVHDEPRGANAARNRAIGEARGRFVTGLDDDDQLSPEHVTSLLAAYRPSHAFVASSRVDVSKAGPVVNRHYAGKLSLDDLLHGNKVGNQALVERARVLAVGGFDERLAALQDYDLWVRLTARYGPCLKLPDATYFAHTDHAAGRISQHPERQLRALAQFVDKHGARMRPAHRASMELLRLKLAGERYGAAQVLRHARVGNLRTAASLVVNSRAPWVQRAYHRYKAWREPALTGKEGPR